MEIDDSRPPKETPNNPVPNKPNQPDKPQEPKSEESSENIQKKENKPALPTQPATPEIIETPKTENILNKELPKIGDRSNMSLYALLMLTSGTLLLLIGYRRRKDVK